MKQQFPINLQNQLQSIDNQLDSSATSPKTKTCPICITNQSELNFYSVGCSHKYCLNCLKQHIHAKFQQYQLIKCCNEDCNHIIDRTNSSVYHKLSNNYKRRIDKILDNFDRATNIRPCINCKTGRLIQKIDQNNKHILSCNNCSQLSCYNCFYPIHSGSCSSVQKLDIPAGCGQCRKCLSIIQKKQGCNHVKCMCGYQFCFECGFHWDPSHICEYKLQTRTGISKWLCNLIKIIFAIPLSILLILFCLTSILAISFSSGLIFGLLGWIQVLNSFIVVEKQTVNTLSSTLQSQANLGRQQAGLNYMQSQNIKNTTKCEQNNKISNGASCIILMIWLLLMPVGFICLFLIGLLVPVVNLCWSKKLTFEPDLLLNLKNSIISWFDIYLLI